MDQRIRRIYAPMSESGFYILLCLQIPNHGYGIDMRGEAMKPEEKKEVKELEIDVETLKDVSGGSALDNVPVVDEHDYDDDIRQKIGGN